MDGMIRARNHEIGENTAVNPTGCLTEPSKWSAAIQKSLHERMGFLPSFVQSVCHAGITTKSQLRSARHNIAATRPATSWYHEASGVRAQAYQATRHQACAHTGGGPMDHPGA